MRRGISSKVVDSGNRERVGIIDDQDFVDAALVWFQDREPIGLAPTKAVFQQVVLFRVEWFEHVEGKCEEVRTYSAPSLLDLLAPVAVPQLKHSISFKQPEIAGITGQREVSEGAPFTAQTRN